MPLKAYKKMVCSVLNKLTLYLKQKGVFNNEKCQLISVHHSMTLNGTVQKPL